jgi:nucleoid DNA-binding protein
LPLLEEINPTYKNSLNNLITVANYECEIVDDKIEEVKELIFKEGKIQTPVFAKLKKAYKIKILQNYIKDELKNPNLKKIEQILEFIEDEIKKGQDPQFRKWKTFSLNSKKFLYVNKKEIFKE